MRTLSILIFGVLPAVAQTPLVRVVNLGRPFSGEFQIGDRFEIQITGAPWQPISVRTVRQGWTDWGPVVGATDSTGHWSIAGQFEKRDFGSWKEAWTVGGKLAAPAIQFDIKAPCIPGGAARIRQSGMTAVLTCDTAEGQQSFVTPSSSEAFRTPDGRLVPARPSEETPDQYHREILSYMITANDAEAAKASLSSSRGALGDETADLIAQLIGPNALTDRETQNVLAVIRAAFEAPASIAPDATLPSRTLSFLSHLADCTNETGLRQLIAETIGYVQSR